MTHYALWGLFLTSLSVLIILLLRNKFSVQWLAYIGLNFVLAAVLLYAVNGLGEKNGFHIPINLPTISTIGLLGVPGLIMLAALKITLYGIG